MSSLSLIGSVALVCAGLIAVFLTCYLIIRLTARPIDEPLNEFERSVSRRADILERMGK